MKLQDLEVIEINDDPRFLGLKGCYILLPDNEAVIFQNSETAQAYRQGWRMALEMTMDLPTKEISDDKPTASDNRVTRRARKSSRG